MASPGGRTYLFDPYVTTKTSGSGLGLAIVQKIVDEHGGSVRVGKAVDGGASFTVRLPAVAIAANEAEIEEAEPMKTNVLDERAHPGGRRRTGHSCPA